MGVPIAALKRCATQEQQRQNRPVSPTAQNQKHKSKGQSQLANYQSSAKSPGIDAGMDSAMT